MKAQLTEKGYTVSKNEIQFSSSCGGKYCKPDIIYSTKNGKIRIFEVKTGNASLSIRQSEIYPQIKDGNAIPKNDVAEMFGLKVGIPLKNQNYPNGIPLKTLTFKGLYE